ncbi:MAG: hypothetical protein RMJ98_12250 [Myxococcales bacterium]|nr:hypothetical protein [Polyangiaceae bacterium]MDW8250059.1 hypothetical protein [Myxococcales bacterium]
MTARPVALPLTLLAMLLSLMLLASDARAQPGPLVVEGAPGNVVELAVGKGGHEGSFFVRNTGNSSLPVRVRLATSDEDVRLPRGLSVTFENKVQNATLAPGEARKVQILWTPSQGRAREVYGHLALEVGGTVVHVGLHGELGTGASGFLARHILTVLLLLPLLTAVVALLSKLRDGGEKISRGIAVAHLALATWLLVNLERDFGRLDGNEGLQYMERGPVGPVEAYLGVDGASALVSWGLAATLLAGSFLLPGQALAVLSFSVAGLTMTAFCQDLAWVWAGWALGLGGLVWLGGKERLRVSGSLALLSLGALAALIVALRGAAGGMLLLSGHEVIPSLLLPALLRSNFLAPGQTLLGLPLAAGGWVLLCIGVLPLAGAWPGGGWLRGACSKPGSSLLAAGIVLAAIHTLLRLGAGVIPEGVVWAAPALSWGGAALVLVGGLGAWGEQVASTRGSWWMSVQVGFALVGLGSGTPQGLVAALWGVAMGALGWLLSCEKEPSWSGGLGGLVVAGIPGLAGFWGPALAWLGAVTRYPGAALLAALGWAAAVGAAVRGLQAGQGKGPWGAAVLLLVLGIWPGGGLRVLERWGLDYASYLYTPGPTWVAMRSPFPAGYGGRYGGDP